MNRLKSIVSFAVALTVLCTCAANTFATGTGTDNSVEEVILSQDFDGQETQFSGIVYAGSTLHTATVASDGAGGGYLQFTKNTETGTTQDNTPYIKLDLRESVKNAQKYVIRFDMRFQPGGGNGLYLYAKSLWQFGNASTDNHSILSENSSPLDTAITQDMRKGFKKDTFYTYEIIVDKSDPVEANHTATIKAGEKGGALRIFYENAKARKTDFIGGETGYDDIFMIKYNKMHGNLAIDNIVVKGYRAASDISKLGVSRVNGIAITGNNVGIDSEYKGNVKLELDAVAESGIKQISVSVDDGDLQTVESPYILEIDNPEEKASQTVKVYAESNNGGEKETQLTLNYSSVNTKNSKVFEDCDFEAGEGNSLKSGIKTVPGCGIIEVKQLDEDHGNSLTVGVGDQVGNGDIPYADIPLEGNSEVITLNYDILSNETVTNSNNSKKVILLNLLIGEEKKTLELVRFYEKYTKILGTDYYDYKLDEWYNFSFKIDTGTNRISLYLNGVLFASDKKIHSGDNEKIDLTHVRVYGPGELGCGYIAIDNINVVGYYEMPTISSTEQNSESPKKLTVNLSSEIFGDSITKDTVKVINTETGNAVDIEKLEYSNKTITITLSKLLAKDAQYKVVITSDAMLSPVVGFDNDVSHTFTTQPGEIKNTSSISRNGTQIVASISIENKLQETQTVYAVLTRWKGNTALPIAVKKLELSNGEAVTDSLSAELDNSGITHAQLYLYSDLTASKFLGEKIINLQIN